VTWAIESNLDHLAESAGIDPLELRLINCNQPGEVTPMGLKVSSCGLEQCLKQTGERLGWQERKGPGAKSGEAGQNGSSKRRGTGLASLFHVGGSGRIYRSDGSGIILKLDDFGNVNVSYGGVEMGQGLHSVLSLAVAEAVGVRPDKVFIHQTDTATCPWDVGTHASRGAFMACNAAILAADKLRRKIFSLAQEVFAAQAAKNLKKYRRRYPDYQPPPSLDLEALARQENFDLQGGLLKLKQGPPEPWLSLDLGQVLRAVHFRSQGTVLSVDAFYDPPNELPDWSKGKGNMSATYAYGTQGAEVEVDEETGEVTILKLVAIHDVGRILNKQTLLGQIYGALAQGVGYALFEHVLTHEGKILNPDFTDYKIATAHEMSFPMEVDFVETDDQFGPFGAKGVGESGLVPTAPAIANAIYDAVGVRIKDLPITPERVLAALEEQQR